MASPHRTTRSLVVTTCLLASLGVPAAAAAAPPDHAPAHGREDRDDGTRTATATTNGREAGGGTQAEDGGDTGRGRENAPGQRKKADDGPTRGGAAAPDPVAPGSGSPSPPPASAPGGPSAPPNGAQPPSTSPGTPPSTAPPTAPSPSGEAAGVPATPATSRPGAAPSATAPETRGPLPVAAPDVAPNVVGTFPGATVWRPDLGGPVRELLQGVDRGVQRLDELVPRALLPRSEPLARFVPLLLAVLGAFLALQRGIGTGLGHVPMVASAAPRDPVRRD